MMRLRASCRYGLLVLAGLGTMLATGCGEKIAIPLPVGDFGTSQYVEYGDWPAPDARQIAMISGNVYLLTSTALEYRDTEFNLVESRDDLLNASAFCTDRGGSRFFVFEAATRRIRVFEDWESGFAEMWTATLPDTIDVTHLVASPRGAEVVAGAETFLYLTDGRSHRIHRYAVEAAGGLTPFGILSRPNGNAVRFVHVPRGMSRDLEDNLLVCDADPARNWVIRFDPTPDLDDGSEYRGKAVIFADGQICQPEPAPEEVVLGNAPACNQTDWEGAPGDTLGEFHEPQGVAVDGEGGIYVADTLNDRIQRFSDQGIVDFDYRGADDPIIRPFAITVGDKDVDAGVFLRGAYMFLLVEEPAGVKARKFISGEYYRDLNRGYNPDPR